MKENNVVLEKNYLFALRIIKLYLFVSENKKEKVISKQLLRSGTSIGANVEEAVGAQSKKDFFTKLNIAYKEARESHYWIRLLRDSEFLDNKHAESILSDCDELLKIIGTILNTVRKQLAIEN